MRGLLVLVLLTARLPAADVLWAWDDGSGYGLTPSASVSSIPPNATAGDGWNTQLASGFPVGWNVTSNTAQIVDGPFGTGSTTYFTTDTAASLSRSLPASLTPTAAQPIWFGCILQGANLQAIGRLQGTCTNTIQFSPAGFHIGTDGPREDGVAGDTNSPLVWSIQASAPPTPSSMVEDDANPHLMVIEVQPTLLSFWYFASTTGSPTATPSATQSISSNQITTVTWSAPKALGFAIQGSFLFTHVCIGSSFTAVTDPGMPHVTSAVSPATGITTGGDVITITGTNFDNTSTVTFGGSAAPLVRLVSSTTLLATAPAGSGTVDLQVSNTVGSVVHAAGFTYVAPSSTDPTLVTAPQIATHGSIAPGASWSVDTGAWSPAPTALDYYWISSPDGQLGDAQPIPGATTNQYAPTIADLGQYLAAVVTPHGTTHLAYAAFQQVIAGSTATTGGSASATGGTTSAAAVTGGTAGSSCGLGGLTGLLLAGALWLRRARVGSRRAEPAQAHAV